MRISPINKIATVSNTGLLPIAQLLLVAIAAWALAVALTTFIDTTIRWFAAAITAVSIPVYIWIERRQKVCSREATRDVPATATQPRSPGEQSEDRRRAAPSWSSFPSSLGPFNPDDGLDLRVSPYFVEHDDIAIPTTFSDNDPWD
jgi:hypothetical protein